MRFLIIFCLIISASDIFSQKDLKSLDHDDFLIWKSIHDPQLSPDGNTVSYRLLPGEGDPVLMIFRHQDSTQRRIERVSKSTITYDGQFIAGLINPHRDSLRSLERKKVEKKKWPSDTLFILNIQTNDITRIPLVTNYKLPDKLDGWIAFTIKREAIKSDTVKEKSKKEIQHLIIRQLETGRQDTLFRVKEYGWAEKASRLIAIADDKDSTQAAGVYYWSDFNWKILKREKGDYSKPAIEPEGKKVAFVANHDTTKAQIPPFELYYFEIMHDSAEVIAATDSSLLPLVSQHAELDFSDDGKYLYYGRAEKPFVKDTSLLDDESVNVEIWSTSDPVLYTTQNVNRPADEKRSYLHVFDTYSKKHIQIGSLSHESAVLTKEKNSRYALVYTDRPYQKSVAWLGDAAKDLAVIDLHTGKKTEIKKGLITQPVISPGGKYAFGYSDADSTWWAYHFDTNKFSFLNSRGLTKFYDELNDIPGFPNSYSHAGWMENDEALILYDRYDMWEWNPLTGTKPNLLTNGRSKQMVYRYIKTDPEETHISSHESWLLHVTDDVTKSSAYGWYQPETKMCSDVAPQPILYSKQVIQAREADIYLFRKENFTVFPDLQLTTDRFGNAIQVSNANPQQSEYKWGTIELYEWMDWDSVMRRGLLVKPHGWDPLRSSPTIVNFYERYTDALHLHPAIEPHRSTINYAFYASRGYVIFNPDISYEIGKPGESAYRIVMSGVESLVKKRIADPNNLALQGHSWGGYQIAYIVTRTDIFKCAEAGASVVNMTSAYGGIRWGTGLSRMFQYELAQSRIGKTLWEDPQRYIANSPLFKIHKITTPLLLMHNDEDAAVPFEQGIEFYLALRRLGKTAWLLNYTGEPHWPTKWHNKKDFQIRMSQFFDHYLKGAPMPRWMEKGIPALQRGIDRGY